ncbi:unnamed protein product [Darwinula stevensoni]|uniref:Uncharacterized protein n=1 Tax=Darwinula stevensoni TaxID=69355 RepID=A0A7R8X077_9CRUS|nr:unnamed protein product [Darwinula stevensoni]CAG0878616.1 unnamed protein product [Darwinula stevensoni]
MGALFTDDQRGGNAEVAFKYAIHTVNKNITLLPGTVLLHDIQYVHPHDSFYAERMACRQLSGGVQALFGPADARLGAYVQSVCDALDVPHLDARLDFSSLAREREFAINLFPGPEILSQAYREVVRYMNWTSLFIIYEEDLGLVKLRDFILTPPFHGMDILVQKGNSDTFIQVLNETKKKDVYNMMIDIRPQSTAAFLKAILDLDMNDYKYHYLFTSFDMETFDLKAFEDNFVNMTAFRLVETGRPEVRAILRELQNFQAGARSSGFVIESESALMYDSVHVFAQGLQALDRSTTLRPANLSCDDVIPWSDGSSLFNYINLVEWRGLTGPIQFKEGRRTNVKLDLLKLKRQRFVKVGEWSESRGVNITNHSDFYDIGPLNVTLKVITIVERPFVMMRPEKSYAGNARFYGFCVDLLGEVAKMVGFRFRLELVPDGVYGVKNPFTGEWNGIVRQLMTREIPYVMISRDNATGNYTFTGFCIDMLKAISNLVGFQYEIKLVDDGVYGIFNPETGKWNGMVGSLIDKKADLAVGSMTINYARESVIDFTKPFMNLGISILFKVPTSPPTRLFSFMNPLAIEIWLYVLAAYVLVSITLFIVARFSPYEWYNPHPCVVESNVVENQFSLANCFWYAIGTLMQQSDLNPKAASTRIVGAIWWFFTLIIISSYTANLAAFLTVERMITPIESSEDLADQSTIEYGTLKSGSTMTFFRDSKIETYQKMWRFMENRKPSVFVDTYEEGIRKVLEGNYAFLMESTMLDYSIQRNCNLTQIGGLLDSKGYGIATPMGSPWRDKISLAILELQEKGTIAMMYNKWWKNAGDTCKRQDRSKESKASALGVDNIGRSGSSVTERIQSIGGVFVVLLCGLAFAVIIAILEFCRNSKKNAQTDRSMCSELAEELCFAVRCCGSRQRPALKRQCSRCMLGTTYVSAAGLDLTMGQENGVRHRTADVRKNSYHCDCER